MQTLSVTRLKKDQAGFDIGYWGFHNDKDGSKLVIVGDDKRGYTLVAYPPHDCASCLAHGRHITIIGSAPDLLSIVRLYNQYITKGYTGER